MYIWVVQASINKRNMFEAFDNPVKAGHAILDFLKVDYLVWIVPPPAEEFCYEDEKVKIKVNKLEIK